MSVTSNRIIGVSLSGDVDAPNMAYPATENANSPGEIDVVQLTDGDTTLTCPARATAITIIPPAANTHFITLKGDAGDVGLVLQLVDPSSIAIYPTETPSLILSATTTAASCRVIWS